MYFWGRKVSRFPGLRLARVAAIVLLCFLTAGLLQPAALTHADKAFIPILQRADHSLRDFAIVSRRPVTDKYDLVLALGSRHSIQKTDGEWFSWLKEDLLGIFLQDQRNANRVFSLAIEPGPPCRIHLEQVTAQSVLISCPGEYDWGNGADDQDYILDLTAKSVLRHYTFKPVGHYVLVRGADGPIFVASDGNSLVAGVWESSSNSFRLIPDSEANYVEKQITIQVDSGPGFQNRVPVVPKQQRVAFGPDKKFELVLHPLGSEKNGPVIVEHTGTTTTEFKLPKTSIQEWAADWPDEKANGATVSSADISDEIGPFQVDGDILWFGKTFYNGEGTTGVGGFGYFDALSRSFKIYSPRLIWPWAASALLVEPRTVWLGLVHYGEGWTFSGGLLEWDRATATAQRIPLKASINQIMRWGNTLYLATGDGVETVRGSDVSRYIVEREQDGAFRVIECEGGYR